MLKLDNVNAKFSSLNVRAEFHGEEKVGAADISLKVELPAESLDQFNPDLRPLLFVKHQPEEGDLLADLREENGVVMDWRFRDLKMLNWDYEGDGYRFVIWSWQDEEQDGPAKEDLVMIQTSVDKFKIKPKSGAMVEVSFKVSGRPTPKEIGRLFELQGEFIDVTLNPPGTF